MGQLYGQFDESKSSQLPLFVYWPVCILASWQLSLCLGHAKHGQAGLRLAQCPFDVLLCCAEGVGICCCMQTLTSGLMVCWLAT